MSRERSSFANWPENTPQQAFTPIPQREEVRPRFTIPEPPAVAGVKASEGEPQRWRELHRCVAALLEANCGIHISAEKRTHRRFPFHKPLTITPINDKNGRREPSNSFPAFGIDISSLGMGFLSRQLIPTQQAILTCNAAENAFVNMLFEPRWVRFTRGGWYQIGGRLVDVLDDTSSPAPGLRLMDEPPTSL